MEMSVNNRYVPFNASYVSPLVTPHMSSHMSENSRGNTAWGIKYNEISLIRELGRGSYGCVILGKWRDSDVAGNLKFR